MVDYQNPFQSAIGIHPITASAPMAVKMTDIARSKLYEFIGGGRDRNHQGWQFVIGAGE